MTTGRDWGAIDDAPMWSCVARDPKTKLRTLWWTGKAATREEAHAVTLRAAACARTIAGAIERAPLADVADEIDASARTNDDDGRPSLDIAKGITMHTAIAERRALGRRTATSDAVASAIRATFDLAAANAKIPAGWRATPDFNAWPGTSQISYGIGVFDPKWNDTHFPTLEPAVDDALKALNMAFWALGGKPPANGPLSAMPTYEGRKSATLDAAWRAPLAAAKAANLATATGMLRRLKLDERAQALIEAFA